MYFQDIYFSYQIFRHELTSSHSRIIPTVASLPLTASHLSHIDGFSTQLQQQSPISLHPPRCTAETTVFIRSSVRQSHIHLVMSIPGSSYVSNGNLVDQSHSTVTSDFASTPRSKEISITRDQAPSRKLTSLASFRNLIPDARYRQRSDTGFRLPVISLVVISPVTPISTPRVPVSWTPGFKRMLPLELKPQLDFSGFVAMVNNDAVDDILENAQFYDG